MVIQPQSLTSQEFWSDSILNEDEPVSHPSQGLLAWVDHWGIPLVIIIFSLGTLLALLATRDNTVSAVSWVWMLLAVCVTSVLWLLPRTPRFSVAIQRWPARVIPWIAIAPTVGLIVILAYNYSLHMPRTVSLSLWITFLPGLVFMVQSGLSRDRQTKVMFGLQTSNLTRMVLLYATAAAALLFLPISAAFWESLKTVTSDVSGKASLGYAVDLLSLFTPSIWASISILFTYYLMRRAELDKFQAARLARFKEIVSQINDPLDSLPDLAHLIHRLLQFRRVVIVIPDENYETSIETKLETLSESQVSGTPEECYFTVKAAAGEGAGRLIGFRFSMLKGISHRSMITMVPQIVPDVKKDPDAIEPEWSDTKSELHMPIFDPERSDVLVMNIVIQDIRRGAFSGSDQKLLEQVGRYIVESLTKQRNTLRYAQLQEELDKLSALKDYWGIVTQALRSCEILFRTSLVAYTPLGLGTRLPLKGRTRIQPRAFKQPSFLDGEAATKLGSDILYTVECWRPLFVTDASVRPFWKKWTSSEGIKSLALLPIGTQDHPIGLLFIGFPNEPYGFASYLKLFITSLAQGLGRQLAPAHFWETLLESFFKPTIDLHRFLSEEGLGRGEIERRLKDMEATTGSNKELREVLASILAVRDRVYAATAVRLPDFERVSLAIEIAKFEADLKQQAHYKNRLIAFRIDEAINSETAELKMILYRLITEAIINAFWHGDAKQVFIRLARLKSELVLTVVDRGKGMVPSKLNITRSNSDPGSILALSAHLQELCGASRIDWGWTKPNLGTFLRIRIPVLPDPSAPMYIDAKDWIDEMEVEPIAWQQNTNKGSETIMNYGGSNCEI